jgi:ribosomal protein S18 acetylase RimI-like enzyme
VIRAAEAADVPAVLSLWQRARSGVASVRDDEEMIERLLVTDPEALLVVEREGAIVGSLIAGWDGWRGNMYRLAVAPDLRRGGLGRDLVAAGEQRFRELGCFRVTALVGGEDDPARNFWNEVGYLHDPRIARYVRNL